MSDAFDDVVSYFKKEYGKSCMVEKEERRVTTAVSGQLQPYVIVCSVVHDIFRLGVLGELKIPKNKMVQACVLANMINAISFSFFYIASIASESEELIVETTCVVKGCKLSREAIGLTLGTACGEADRFYPAFQKLIWGDVSPEEAFDSIKIKTEE
ncbi:unnamed protein product [marine sediment metagenome]|uniref:Uncharacterized protein n=1 Tax=marine sediment metagenome TaxID=412755 RepID=X1MNB5_9ZZZZ